MTAGKGAADFQLLTDGASLFRTYNLQFPQSAACAAGNGNQVYNLALIYT